MKQYIIAVGEMPYEPRYDTLPIYEVTLDRYNVYLKDRRENLWRVWVGYDGQPNIELIKRG